VVTIECVLNGEVQPISMKWCNEEVTNNQEHQALQGKTDNNLEDNKNKCNSTLGDLNFHKEQDIHHESGGVNISDTVNKKSPKRPRRQRITRNNDFLWTISTKN
jgi:hypothetical protein